MLNLFLFKVCNTRNAISQDKSFVLVNQYVCSADYGSFFLNISLMYFLPVQLRYFLNDSEMVPVSPYITVITCVFTFHTCCIPIVRYLYLQIFQASFLITFLSLEIAVYINTYVPDYYVGMIVRGGQVIVVVVVVVADLSGHAT